MRLRGAPMATKHCLWRARRWTLLKKSLREVARQRHVPPLASTRMLWHVPLHAMPIRRGPGSPAERATRLPTEIFRPHLTNSCRTARSEKMFVIIAVIVMVIVIVTITTTITVTSITYGPV